MSEVLDKTGLNIKGRRYVVFRSDGFIIITDRLRDARRSLKAKYLGVLERYGNVIDLPLSRSFKENLPKVVGIYKLDQVEDVLKKIYRSRSTVKSHMRWILKNSIEIKRRYPEPPPPPPPIKLIPFDNDRLLIYILENSSIWWYEFENYYSVEFKNAWAIYNEGDRVFLSIRKDRSLEEIVEYSLKKGKMFVNDLIATINDFLEISCEDVKEDLGKRSGELCKVVSEKLREIKFILEYVSEGEEVG